MCKAPTMDCTALANTMGIGDYRHQYLGVTDEYGDTVLYIFRDERVDSCIGIPRPYVTRYSSNFYLPAALFSVLFESHAIVRCNRVE